MTDVRARVLAQTPLFVNYDVPLEQRLSTFNSEPNDLPEFYAGFRPAVPLTGEELRVASFGAWDGLLSEVVVNDSEFIDGYRRELLKSISALPAIADADLRSALKAAPVGFGWAQSPDEGWAAVGLTAALAIDPSIVLDAVGKDPAGIVSRWSLSISLPDAFRLQLVRVLLLGSAERRLCAAIHLSWMTDQGMQDGTPLAEDLQRTIESMPDEVAVAVLGYLLGHYLTWSRNAHAALQLNKGFEKRLTFLADEINRRAKSADDIARATSGSKAGDAEMAAFLQSAMTSVQPKAAALTWGSNVFFEAFAPIADDRDARVSVLSFRSYLELSLRLPMTADVFDGIFDGLLCDEPSYLTGQGVYERDRTRAIILCAIAGLSARERDDSALSQAVGHRISFLSALPPGYVSPFSDEFRRFVTGVAGLNLPNR